MTNIPFQKGQIIKKGDDFFLQIQSSTETRYYYIHPWDKERLNLTGRDYKSLTEVWGQLFCFQKPNRRHHIVFHGWVHPGTLTIQGQPKPSEPSK